MLCYAIFDLYPTHWSLLMEDFALAASGVWAVLLLSVLTAWLVTIVLLIVLLPAYYLFVALQPVIEKIALGLQKGVLAKDKVSAIAALRFPARARALFFETTGGVKLWLRSA